MTDLQILLLSGPFRVGKSTLADALIDEQGFRKISSGGYLRSLLENGDSGDRATLQELGDRLDTETDYRWLIDPLARRTISESPDQSRWLIDAVRKARQVEHFRAEFSGAVRHVHLSADEPILQSRYTEGLDAYRRDLAHPNEQSSRSLGVIADLTVDMTLPQLDEVKSEILNLWNR